MNSNQPKILSKIDKTSKISSISNFANESLQNSNVSPINRVSILETEEQKKIVRTNVYEPNNSKSGNKQQQFTVVTELISRSSNISFDQQHNSFNNGPLNFSFNQTNSEQQMNQSFQNKSINIHIADSSSKKEEIKNIGNSSSNEYKLLIKKISSQLKKRIRTPTQGYFYFAFQKGNYPLMIIRKLENQIINHSIEFNNDIFRIYTEKYNKYKELIKRIAFLLKRSMKNPYFWQNQRYSSHADIMLEKEKQNESIPINIAKNTLTKNSSKSIIIKNNKSKTNNNIKNKSPDLSKKAITNNYSQNIKNINNRNVNQKQNTNNNFNNYDTSSSLLIQKKTKIQNNKIKNNLNNNQRNNQNNISSHKNLNFVNQFNTYKEGQKINLTKKNDFINNNPFLYKPQIKNKEKSKALNNNSSSSNNLHCKTETASVTSTTNRNEDILNLSTNTYNSNINKEKQIIEKLDNEMMNTDDNRIDIIKEETKITKYDDNIKNRDINLNIIHTQSEPILYSDTTNDIEMKNNFIKVNSDIIPEKKVDVFHEEKNINSETMNNINNHYMNINTGIALNNQINNINIEKTINNINTGIDINNINSADINNKKRGSLCINIIPNTNTIKLTNSNNIKINNNILDTSIANDQKEKRISINSLKSSGRKINIRLSTFKKEEEKINTGKDKSMDTNKESTNKVISTNITNINNNNNIDSMVINNNDNNSNNIDSINIKNNIITNLSKEQISFVQKFNELLTNNNVMIQFNIPVSIDEKGQNYLKQNSFWEKYIHYVYFNYLINNKKMSLFSFVQLIEQYFLWCEDKTPEINKKYKILIIDTMNKIYDEKEINQFLSMNKIQNLDELFKKYEIFICTGNKKNDFIYGKEIEIKLSNTVDCNCDLCKNEIACMNKMSEINKNLITNVNTDNLFFIGNYKENENNNKIIEDKKNTIFSKSKTIHSFESVYQYFPPLKSDKDINEAKQEEIKNSSSPKKGRSQNKSMNKNKKKQSIKKKEIEQFVDVPQNKIDYYLETENEKEKEKEKEKDKEKSNDISYDDENDKKKRKKSQKEVKNKRQKNTKYKDDKTGSESDEEKVEKNKKNKKKQKNKEKSKNNLIIINDSESEKENYEDSNKSTSSGKKKKIQYPKVSRKNKGKK